MINAFVLVVGRCPFATEFASTFEGRLTMERIVRTQIKVYDISNIPTNYSPVVKVIGETIHHSGVPKGRWHQFENRKRRRSREV